MEFANKNSQQVYFNQVKGIIDELNDGQDFCSVTITCGHESTRRVNLSTRKTELEQIKSKFQLGDKVVCRFYISSKKKETRWYTSAILLSVNFD